MSARAARDVVELLLPGGCVSCGVWIPRREPRRLVCPPCRSRLGEAPWPRCPRCHHPRGSGRVEAGRCLHCAPWPEALVAARWAHPLRPPASRLVHGLKYDGWTRLAAFMADRMRRPAEALVAHLGGEGRPVVVPVPTTPARIRARGYNQAALLAEELSVRLGVPTLDALRRVGGGASQTALAPDARRENVRDVFRTAPGARVAGAVVVLVDDVLTTGATAGEAACVLGAAGAEGVGVVTFARALPELGPGRAAAA